jgi:hypothetical protein
MYFNAFGLSLFIESMLTLYVKKDQSFKCSVYLPNQIDGVILIIMFGNHFDKNKL